jgi:hypothetical protein
VTHPLGDQFPREGFVQAALERHFSGCELVDGGTVDFVCRDSHGVKWIIEAKGETSATGLDFRTGLGQILTAMGEERANYGLAVPQTPKFERLYAQIAPWVRERLNLYWLLVDEDGDVAVRSP